MLRRCSGVLGRTLIPALVDHPSARQLSRGTVVAMARALKEEHMDVSLAPGVEAKVSFDEREGPSFALLHPHWRRSPLQPLLFFPSFCVQARALEQALKEINSRFGKNSVMKLGAQTFAEV